MKAIYKNLLVVLISLFGAAVVSYAQPNIKGKVTDENGLVAWSNIIVL